MSREELRCWRFMQLGFCRIFLEDWNNHESRTFFLQEKKGEDHHHFRDIFCFGAIFKSCWIESRCLLSFEPELCHVAALWNWCQRAIMERLLTQTWKIRGKSHHQAWRYWLWSHCDAWCGCLTNPFLVCWNLLHWPHLSNEKHLVGLGIKGIRLPFVIGFIISHYRNFGIHIKQPV